MVRRRSSISSRSSRPTSRRPSGLIGETGWVAVDRYTLETRFPGVYAIGDVVTIPLTLGKPLPKAGVFAHGEGEVVAHRGRDHRQRDASPLRRAR